mmetsp:Transcript_43068/g.106281  ORF Transcript_43068/g.106281 Transcript_43068/m.106281 type:complete len:94 (+) Transcript_43068:151-432(+)
MGVAKHKPEDACLCCPLGGGSSAVSSVTDVQPLPAAQRYTLVLVWRRVCGTCEAPPEVLRRIFALASVTRTRLVRRQVLPDLSSLSLCGEANF